MIKLAEATIDNQDIDQLIEWLKTYPRLTKGPLTKEYEDKWSSYLDVDHSTFVNSGSSANLLMLATLLESGDLKKGDSVIVPAVSWATDVAPIMQLGLRPILCDCNLQDYSIHVGKLKTILEEGVLRVERNGSKYRDRASALIVVPVLGLVPDMKKIQELCRVHDVILLEDCCEALGSEYRGQKLGTFGEMSTFSTYFGHHISTIEGGMVCTSNPRYDKILKSIRSHGWDRDWAPDDQERSRKKWKVTEFDSLYTFYHAGFNVRSTDLQAFIGLKQLDKLEQIVEVRNKNFALYNESFGVTIDERNFVSNFAYPVVSKNREQIVKALQKENIEVRPLICGSMGVQPFYVKAYGETPLRNADKLRKHGMYLPNHHLLSEDDIKRICDIVKGLI